MSSKIIRDPIHGNIRLDDLATELMDTSYVQRLRNIKQNGFCYLVYPSMNSTRFEHSLGVYHLAGVLSSHLCVSEVDRLHLQAASLLHDIGHAPFSHTFDRVFGSYGFDHEVRTSELILDSEIADILKSSGLNPQDVSDLVHGRGKLGKILSSEVDVDKMDYLVRDAYYAGVAYGVTDVERLLYSISLVRGDIIVSEGGLEAAESLLINRNMMYQTVYRHHTKRIAEAMMSNALEKLLTEENLGEIVASDDIGFISRMRGVGGYASEMVGRIDARILFKCVFSEPVSNIVEESRAELSKSTSEIEAKIAGDLNIEAGYLLLDYPESSMNAYRVKVKTKSGLKPILDVSPLARSLEISEREKLTLNIYVRQEDSPKISEFKPQNYFSLEQRRLNEYT
ncbi:MAG: HD domain-containing protein [Candidatus Altiarchaeota archaeon]|nr:HD domain-containing protein [Candidatus Altiarchaeota archaeon]